MSLSTQKFHEAALQLLFSYEMGAEQSDQLIKLLMKELSLSKKNVREADAYAAEIFSYKEELDQKIAATSIDYPLERIGLVEKSVLRMALFEICVKNASAHTLILREALRLAKKFSTKEGGQYINAILDPFLNHEKPPLSS